MNYMLYGFASLIFGLIIILDKGVEYFGVFRPGKLPGMLLILIGIALFVVGYRRMSSEVEQVGEKCKVCVKCRKTYYSNDLKNSVCPKCGGIVEDLEGFYSRHPENSHAPKS